MSTKKSNATKTNATVNFNELFDILTNTISNKNALTTELNAHGYIANMRSKNPFDVTTVNNDLYYQLSDGTRLFFGTSRKTIQLWCTDDFMTHYDEIVPDSDKYVTVPCNDSIRHAKTGKCIPFILEWFNQFMTNYNKFYAVRFADLKTEK